MDQELPCVRYKSKESAKLADLLSIRNDLLATEHFCERLVAELRRTGTDQDAVLIDALWSAALIRYSRCFASGKRTAVDVGILKVLEGDPIGAHTYFKNQRDKLVAHSVNAFEECTVGLVLSPPEESKGVIGTVDLQARIISDDEGSVAQLARLARDVQALIGPQIDSARKCTLEEARSESIEDLYKLERIAYRAPASFAGAAGVARKN